MTTSPSASILLIGDVGRDSLAIMKKLMSHPTSPEIHLLISESSKLCQEHRMLCASVYIGDARRATDVLEALRSTEANIVILSSDDQDIVDQFRDRRSWAVVSSMKMPGMEHIRAVVLSSNDVGPLGSSLANVRMGISRLIKRQRNLKVKDRNSHELAFVKCRLQHRTVIVRATSLTDDEASGEILEFGDRERSPSLRIARDDVARYITREVCESDLRGKIVNITGRQ
jgi:hypothetical protein